MSCDSPNQNETSGHATYSCSVQKPPLIAGCLRRGVLHKLRQQPFEDSLLPVKCSKVGSGPPGVKQIGLRRAFHKPWTSTRDLLSNQKERAPIPSTCEGANMRTKQKKRQNKNKINILTSPGSYMQRWQRPTYKTTQTPRHFVRPLRSQSNTGHLIACFLGYRRISSFPPICADSGNTNCSPFAHNPRVANPPTGLYWVTIKDHPTRPCPPAEWPITTQSESLTNPSVGTAFREKTPPLRTQLDEVKGKKKTKLKIKEHTLLAWNLRAKRAKPKLQN